MLFFVLLIIINLQLLIYVFNDPDNFAQTKSSLPHAYSTGMTFYSPTQSCDQFLLDSAELSSFSQQF